jgi:hypothetical protein
MLCTEMFCFVQALCTEQHSLLMLMFTLSCFMLHIITQVDLDFAEENDQRVQLIVHSLKPPFLTSGKNGTKAAFGIKQKVK